MKSKVTVDNWASLLTEELQKSGDQHPGPEWKTFEELSRDQPEIGDARLYKALASLRQQGRVEEREVFLAKQGGRRKVRHIFYRIK
jgi:DNA-binding HxlR family transcriptional regulator